MLCAAAARLHNSNSLRGGGGFRLEWFRNNKEGKGGNKVPRMSAPLRRRRKGPRAGGDAGRYRTGQGRPARRRGKSFGGRLGAKVSCQDSETDTGCAHPPLPAPAPFTPPCKLRPPPVTRPPANESLLAGLRYYLQARPPARGEHLRPSHASPSAFPRLGKLHSKEASCAVRGSARAGAGLRRPDLEESEQLVPHCFPPPELLLFSISIAL